MNVGIDILVRHVVWSDRLSNLTPAVSMKGIIIMQTCIDVGYTVLHNYSQVDL